MKLPLKFSPFLLKFLIYLPPPIPAPLKLFPEPLRHNFELSSVISFFLFILSKLGVGGGFLVDESPDVVIERNIKSISSSRDGPKSNTWSFCIASSSEIS